jgi:hypothetical protein
MPRLQDTGEEIARRGKKLYERTIRAQVEPEHKGKLLVLNLETGEYEMDADDTRDYQDLWRRPAHPVLS